MKTYGNVNPLGNWGDKGATMRKVTFIEKRYASMEFNVDGLTWDVFNDVTGLLVKEAIPYVDAITAVGEINNHYGAVEFGRAN